jgi:hypothetical protein
MNKQIKYQSCNVYSDKLDPWSSHSQITSMLEGLPEGSRVLDIGTASGTLARMCSNRGYVMRGIEPVIDWVDRDLYSEIFIGTLEQTPDTFLEGHSAVVCGDVLEHLVNPEEQLKRLVDIQPSGCIFIISVPNVANIWVRMNLLLGRFDYSDRGILDRTHLHFYTRKTFNGLLKSSGLTINELTFTPIPIDLAFPHLNQGPFVDSLFQILFFFTRLWPTLLAYQWIAKAVKNN